MKGVHVPRLPHRRGGLSVSLLAAFACLIGAGATPRASAEAAHASLVVDANTGATLHSAAADELRHPASLTKMMTLYLAFETIGQGRIGYDSKIKVSQEAASVAPSKLELEPGEEITLIDAMKALVTKSANDMAVAIAERIGGSEANFARLMTAKAHQLGMTKTVFRNASGLPDPGQVTTARDMITLALHLQDDFPKHYGLFSLKSFTYNGSGYRNHNTLLNSYRGTDGIKTGYTRMSGFNLVASVRRDGKHLVGAIFGGASASSRNVYIKALLDRSWSKASTAKTRKPMLIAKASPRQQAKPAVVAALIPPTPQPAVRPARPETPKAEAGKLAVPRSPDKKSPPPPVPEKVASASISAAAAPASTPASRPAVELESPPTAIEPAASPEWPEPAIQIAKVRRIMVAPRVSRPVVDVASLAGEGTDEGSATVRPASPETAAGAAARAAALMPSPSEAATAAPVDPAPPARIVRGAPPSTLQAQADSLARGGRPFATASLASVPAYLHGPKPAPQPTQPAPSPAAGSGGSYQIQIGAFATPLEAEHKLATAGQQAKAVLAGHQPLTLTVRKGERQLYRARFGGFTATAAASACNELRRLSHDCFVNKAE